MFKYLILTIFALGLSLSGFAQDENPIIVMAAQGKIAYQAPGYSSKSLSAGAALKSTGTLTLKAKSTATLFFNGQFQQVKGEKTASLLSLFPEKDGLSKLNFEQSFNDYLIAAVMMAGNPQNPKDAWGTITGQKGKGDGWGTITGQKGKGDGWGTITGQKGKGDGWGTISGQKGKGDGWGGKGNTISTIEPFGKIRSATQVFRWSKPAGAQNYTLEIKNSKGETLVKTTAQDTTLSLELDPAKFKEGQQYLWEVSSAGVKSNTLTFEFGTSKDQTAAIQKAETAAAYSTNPAVVQGLMRAIALEQGEWYIDAVKAYQDAHQIDPKNTLVNLMHAAFWMRNGPKPMAEQAFKQK
ncbi:hypothetical protein [Haliscomenobacter sp.]|uniref:tetratricopeptide repeat protein n=1 Tax=Haliscomenobacter sp. TaxID=2717303 RepID=UPI003365051F